MEALAGLVRCFRHKAEKNRIRPCAPPKQVYKELMKTLLPLVLAALVLASSAAWAADTAAAAETPVLQADNLPELRAKIGTEVIVEGVIKGVGKSPGDGITFLNFGERKTGFVAIVYRSSYDKFPEGFEKYANQKVRVRGTLENYQDRQVEIKISTPDQLEIVVSES